MNEKYHISSSPHIRSRARTDRMMLAVIIALLPATLFGIYNFRDTNAWLLVIVTTLSAVLTEYVYEKCMHKTITIKDYSAAVTGLLLALNLPPDAPLWIGVIGSIFAILVVKQLFGGLGQNFMNPALAARCFLLISFTGRMTRFTYDGITSATPLAVMRGNLETGKEVLSNIRISELFAGTTGGVIGETSVIAILIGAIFLLVTGIIDLSIPGSYLCTFVVFIGVFGGFVDGVGYFNLPFIIAQLCSGGLMLGAWFMATDYVTSPITKNGKIVFGIILGLLTGLFRLFGGSAEGVSYAIIFTNLLVPIIEKVTLPKPFGKGGEK